MSDDCDAFAKKIGQDHCWAYSPDKAILEDWAHKGPWSRDPEPGLQWRRCTNCGRMEEFIEVRVSETERCALLAEMYRNDIRSGWVEFNRGWEAACVAIADAIRASSPVPTPALLDVVKAAVKYIDATGMSEASESSTFETLHDAVDRYRSSHPTGEGQDK